MRAPPPAPRDPLYHTPRGTTAEKKTKGLVQRNDGVTKSYVSGSEKGSIFHPGFVWAHLSSDASLPAALQCELYEVDSISRFVPGCCPCVATRWESQCGWPLRRTSNGLGDGMLSPETCHILTPKNKTLVALMLISKGCRRPILDNDPVKFNFHAMHIVVVLRSIQMAA